MPASGDPSLSSEGEVHKVVSIMAHCWFPFDVALSLKSTVTSYHLGIPDVLISQELGSYQIWNAVWLQSRQRCHVNAITLYAPKDESHRFTFFGLDTQDPSSSTPAASKSNILEEVPPYQQIDLIQSFSPASLGGGHNSDRRLFLSDGLRISVDDG